MSENRNIDIWIAGAFAAFSVDLIVYPLDTLKTRLQSKDFKRIYAKSSGNGFNPSMFRGLYQGVGSVIIATLPSSGAFFTTYEGVKSILEHRASVLPQPLIHALASGTAELVSCAILTPAEVIKSNAQVVDNSHKDRPRVNATLATMQKFRSNPLALWRGYIALAGRNLPFTALQFPLFERIKESVRRYRDDRGLRTNTLLESAAITAVSAGSGGSIAALVTTPVDVVKTRIMLDAADGAAKDQTPLMKEGRPAKEALKSAVETVTKPASRRTSMQIAREIVQESGIKGLFRGGLLRSVWTMLGAGLYLGVYESGRLYLARRRGENRSAEDMDST